MAWHCIVGFNITLNTIYRSFWEQFYGSYDPTNIVIALRTITRSRADLTGLGSQKIKNKIKKLDIQRYRGARKMTDMDDSRTQIQVCHV